MFCEILDEVFYLSDSDFTLDISDLENKNIQNSEIIAFLFDYSNCRMVLTRREKKVEVKVDRNFSILSFIENKDINIYKAVSDILPKKEDREKLLANFFPIKIEIQVRSTILYIHKTLLKNFIEEIKNKKLYIVEKENEIIIPFFENSIEESRTSERSEITRNLNNKIRGIESILKIFIQDLNLVTVSNILPKYEKIKFFTITESGGMGEAGGIKIISKDRQNIELYKTNFFDKRNDIEVSLPLLKEIEFYGMGMVGNLPKEWKCEYLGMGNNLFIHNSVYDKFKEAIKDIDEEEICYRYLDIVFKILIKKFEDLEKESK